MADQKGFPDELIAELEEKYEDIGLIQHRDRRWGLVLRPPKRTEAKMFRLNAKKGRDDAQELLGRQITVAAYVREKIATESDPKSVRDLVNELLELPGCGLIFDSEEASSTLKRLCGDAEEAQTK